MFIPPPSAAAADAAPFAIVIFLSSTSKVAVFKVVVLPLTVKSPLTITSLNVTLLPVPTA